MTLLEQVLSQENLRTACASVLRGVIKNSSKRYSKESLYKKAVAVRKIDKKNSLLTLMKPQIQTEMGELRKLVLDQKYSRSPLYLHRERKSSGGIRILMIHSFLREKILERAVYQVISKVLQRILDNGISYCGIPKEKGSKRKLGIFTAHGNICNTLRSDKFWILKADIEKFFDRLDRKRVKEQLIKHLPDTSLQEFFEDWLNIRVKNPGTDYVITDLGIPQGSCLSALIANLYLLDFDDQQKKVAERQCFRYADDLLFVCKNEQDLVKTEKEMNSFLNKLHLQTKASKMGKYAPGEIFGVLGYAYNDHVISVFEEKITKWIKSLGNEFKKIGKIEISKKKTGKYTKKDVEKLVAAQKKIYQKLRSFSSTAVPFKQLPDNINKRIAHEQAFRRMNQYIIQSSKGINRIRKSRTIKIVEFKDKKGKCIWPYQYPLIIGVTQYLD